MTDSFAARALAWFDHHGRKHLPWQRSGESGQRDAYRVWLSEVMLQQTQVSTVAGYFERFVAVLPTLRDLAAADEDTVFALWSGLGYYRRARHLHRAAQACVARHDGELPADFDALIALPGIGRSTAGAILAQAFGQRFAILDGNVKRVLARYHGIAGYPGLATVEMQLWQHADAHTPVARVADYTQAIMDLGATVCLRAQPRCAICPLAADCVARINDLTATLPTRKPTRSIPTRDTLMLVLRDAQRRVLLERRGPQGVWSGLWSLPEAADMADARQLVQRRAEVPSWQQLGDFTHQFTHYRLHVTPLLFDHSAALPGIADAPDRRWCTPAEIAALGLPAPVRRLLLQVNDATPANVQDARFTLEPPAVPEPT